MRSRNIIFGVVVICVACAAGLFSYAYWKGQAYKENSLYAPVGSTLGASIEDGTYIGSIRSTTMSSTGTTITFSHVTYFEGAEASSTASVEASCNDTQLEACIPTLSRGFYVRPSGAPDFSASVTEDTKIILNDNPATTVKDLEKMVRVSNPVFDITIIGGTVTVLTEKSPL